jgi:hypothetical protein
MFGEKVVAAIGSGCRHRESRMGTTTRKNHVTPKSARRSNKTRADSHLTQAAQLLEDQASDSLSYRESHRLRMVAFALRQCGLRLRNLYDCKQVPHQAGEGA